jgi:GNAT superfamily N-acetyltransferase
MINIEQKHLDILNKILNKYDYSFFIFGSRITNKARKLSDIDLLYFEDISAHDINEIEEAFIESDLAYEVDLVCYNNCDHDFKKIIGNNYICLQASSRLKMIEHNTLGHFTFLPTKLGVDVHELDGTTIINFGANGSMFNIAYGYATDTDILKTIQSVRSVFKDKPFAWWIPPSLKNPELTKALLDQGFTIEAPEYAMICELANKSLPRQKTNLQIKVVTDVSLLQDFINVLRPIDPAAIDFYELLENKHLQQSEKLFVGYAGGEAVTIAILFISEGSAGIFSLVTQEAERGKGYATDMMAYLLLTAKENNCQYATLSASGDFAASIYERLGFHSISQFECFI